jgi:hypothetical protein
MNQQLVIKLIRSDNGNGPLVPVGTVVQSPPVLYTNLKEIMPEANFPEFADPAQLEQYGYGAYEWAYAPNNLPYTKSVDDIGLTKHSDGFWRHTFVERNATQNEIMERTKIKSDQEKHKRYVLLRRTDWTQMPDNHLSDEQKQIWGEYRQQLRDLTEATGWPWNFDWPTPPKDDLNLKIKD